MTSNYSQRHAGTQQIMRWFSFDHLPYGLARDVSEKCAGLADDLLADIPDGPELTTGLRKLLEAKDCFVRAALASKDG